MLRFHEKNHEHCWNSLIINEGNESERKSWELTVCTWLSGCPMKAQKKGKKCIFCALAFFRAHVGQPVNHIGWAILMSLSIYPTNPRTNLWNFCEKTLRIWGLESLSFFQLAIWSFIFFWSHWQSVNIYRIVIIGWNFDDWLPVQNNTCVKICNTV